MTTIVERDAGSSAGASSAMTMIVAIVGLTVIVALALYVLALPPFARENNEPGLRLNLGGSLNSASSEPDGIGY